MAGLEDVVAENIITNVYWWKVSPLIIQIIQNFHSVKLRQAFPAQKNDWTNSNIF